MTEWLSSVRLRLRALLQRRTLEQDLQDEVAFHLAMREEQLRRSGAGDADAGAVRKFGNVTRVREDLHEAWVFAPAAGNVVRDLGYAARSLRRSPGFAGVVVLTLALGIGANTAFFSVVNAVLIRPLGYADAHRLVSMYEVFPRARVAQLPFSAPDFEDLRNGQQAFDAVAAYRNVPFELSGGGASERITGAKVSAELFGTLGVGPRLGRDFSTAEDRPGVHVAILSWRLWHRRYAGSESIIGQRIHLDRQAYTIVGVMPAAFVFPQRGLPFNGEPADIWVPMAFTDRERIERGSMHGNSVVARLKHGASLQATQAELDVLGQRIAARYPPAVRNAGFSPRLIARPLREEISGRFEAPLLMLLGAVGLVLLVACANVANLIMSRAAVRTREFAVRRALGARRGQLAQLLLCEALLLSLTSGVVGIAFAYWAVRAAPGLLVRTIPGLHDLAIDVRVLSFTAVICLGTAVIFALLPLATLDRGYRAKLHLQRSFVVFTVSLACMLLVGAGLLIRSFTMLTATDMGFQAARVLAVSMTLPSTFYTTATSVRRFHDSLSQRLAVLPGVRSVTTATNLPLTTYDLRAFMPEYANLPDAAPPPAASVTYVQGPYFETLGMTLSRGRFFAANESAEDRRVVIVNEKLAALAWPGQNAVGKRLKWGGRGSQAPWLTVVGVIENVADGPIGTEPTVHAYEPFRQIPDVFLNLAVNGFGRDVKAAVLAEGDPGALAALVRREISNLDRELAIEMIRPMDEQVSDGIGPQRFSMQLVGAFAAIALFLASVGLYGLLAFATAQRQKEIAVRMALGAEPRAVVAMVIGQGAWLVALGLLVGVLGSLAVGRAAASLLYQTSPYDLPAFAIIPAVLVPAALLACAIPAWRASRVQPIAALRTE